MREPSVAVVPLEIIVVDDCSTDKTVEVVKEWEKERGVLHALSVRAIRLDRNSGPAAARNAGVREAQGEWIAFLDADDAWLPERLEIGLAIAAGHPEAALICGRTVEMGGEIGRGIEQKETKRTKEEERKVMQVALEEFAVGNPVATSTVLVKKRTVEDVGGFDERFRGPEDYDLWMRIAAVAPIYRSASPMALHREYYGSLSMDDRKFLPQVLQVLDKAFARNGAFEFMSNRRRQAEATQYLNASWMAFQRADRRVALLHLLKFFRLNLLRANTGYGRFLRPGTMLLRYLFGKSGVSRRFRAVGRQAGCGTETRREEV